MMLIFSFIVLFAELLEVVLESVATHLAAIVDEALKIIVLKCGAAFAGPAAKTIIRPYGRTTAIGSRRL